MAKLEWDKEGLKTYETGVDHGVLYKYDSASKSYGNGVAWNGLTSVDESSDGGEPEDLYADNIKYLSLSSTENKKITINAYTYPDEFAECDGSASIGGGKMQLTQQNRAKFGFVYRTVNGNDTEGNAYGYKIHIVYGCLASPSDKEYSTINDSPEAIEFSWEVSTTPVSVGEINDVEYKPTSMIIVDSTKFATTDKAKLTALENKLFGTTDTEPALPTPAQVYSLVTTGSAT